MEYSVVIPVFNERESLALLQERLDSVLKGCAVDYEIIYVDDGSTDSSLETIKKMKEAYPEIRIISLKRNAGKSSALYAGFRSSRGSWIIALDADLQNSPEDIPGLLNFVGDFDFVQGVRVKRRDDMFTKFSSGLAHFFRWLILRDKTIDTGCGLCLFRREIVDSLYFFMGFHRFFGYLVRTHGFSVREVPVRHSARIFGKSKNSIFKRIVEGIFDLYGVLWLRKRSIAYEIKYQDRFSSAD